MEPDDSFEGSLISDKSNIHLQNLLDNRIEVERGAIHPVTSLSTLKSERTGLVDSVVD